MRNKLKPEEQEQIALLEWARLHDDVWPYLIHIRNEGKRSIYEGAKAKKMGLMKGVSDLFLAIPSYFPTNFAPISSINEAGFFIELKSKKGKLSIEQSNFLEEMNEIGYRTGVYYCWTDAAKAICDYLGKSYNGL